MKTAEDDVVQMMRKRVDPSGSRAERYWIEEMWLKNMSYFSGKHHFYIESGKVWDLTQDIPENRVLYKVNLVRSAVVRAAAKIINIHAKYRAVPQSDSIEHRRAAETSEKLFQHIRGATEWDSRLQLLTTMWAAICGSGFVKCYFDPLAGEVGRFYWDDKLTKNAVPSQFLTPEQIHQKDRDGLFEDLSQGEVAFGVCSPFSIFHDWSSRDSSMEGCQWVAERHYVDIDLVAQRYGIDPDDLQPDAGSQGLLNYEEAVAFMSSHNNVTPFNWVTPLDKRGTRCQHIELFERPSARHKKGRRIVYAGGKVLVNRDNPYAGDRSKLCHLPYIKQDWIPHPGRFWGCSLVEDLTSPQHNLNNSRGALLEFLRIFGRPATYIWSDSGIDQNTMTTDPGAVYTINRMSKPPVHAPIPNLPPEVVGVGSLMQGDLNAIASQSDIDGSRIPASLRSGEAIRQMSEYRDIALNVSSKEALRVTRDLGRMSLKLMQMFYDEPRTLRYIGDDNEWGFIDFTGADLTNDLIIDGEPSVMDTASGRRADLLDAIQAGAMDPRTNEQDRDLVLSELRYNSGEEALKTKLRARRNQETEIEEMMRDPLKWGPEGYPVMEWEDHSREIEVLINFMYGQRFRKLPPSTQALIMMHWKKHQGFFMQQQAEQMRMMEAVKGTPGQKGTPSPAKG